MKNCFFVLSFLLAAQAVSAQHDGFLADNTAKISAATSFSANVDDALIQPPNWWVGMQNNEVEVMIHQANVRRFNKATVANAGIEVMRVTAAESPNYLFVTLKIAPSAMPGKVVIALANEKETKNYDWELRSRDNKWHTGGVTSEDFIYLLMPDRFANGNSANDKDAKLDQNCDPQNPFFRHGGDIEGIIGKLDYLQDLGVTTLWLTPVLENDETLKKEGHGSLQAGYHGYHFTDFYKIDKRFGGEAAYHKLSETLHRKGMKLVQDAVYNHISDDHWLYLDPPARDWFHRWTTYTNTSHKEAVLMDPHAAKSDYNVMADGWFTPFLPDVNQCNPQFANYLVQHAIWHTEMYQLDGWRIDTYKYNDPIFMNRCNKALLDEYPNITIFGETTAAAPAQLAYFVESNIDFDIKSNLPGTCDFPAYGAILASLNEPFSWDGGYNRIYQVQAQDFVYKDPNKLVTFLENHDTDRFFSVVGSDMNKYKAGVAWLLTSRGIPHWYYGTEILMKNFKDPTDAEVRKDFPGGWPSDTINKFTKAGRNSAEQEAFDYVRTLAQFRKGSDALKHGKLEQYLPVDGVYVYFRVSDKQTVMVVMNGNDKEKTLDTDRFRTANRVLSEGRNIVTNERCSLAGKVVLAPRQTLVIEW